MVNSSKTPTGKAKKGQVSVRPDGDSIKACFPRSYFADGKQVKLGTGINSDNWESIAGKLQRRLQIELEEGKLAIEGVFNLGRYQEILEEYGLRAKLRLVRSQSVSDDQLPPKPELSLMEIWDMYCEYKKQELRETTYCNTYQGQYRNYLESAIEATKSQDALKIRNWLVENRDLHKVRNILSNLSKAYQLGLKNRLLTHNPYEGMTDEIKTVGAKGKTQDEVENDNDVLDQSKAYTWNEVQVILEFVKDKYPWWHDFLKFKFLTGCRTGEAIAFMWGDVEWDKERILIRRNYDRATKKFYPLKNNSTYKGELVRKFPMPKNGELWNLLKSLPQGKDNEVVLKSKSGKIIDCGNFSICWRGRESTQVKGIIPQLIEQSKLTKYLPPYNTRHTFITHQIFDLGRDEKIVSKWCGHTIDISGKHYQDIAIFAEKINPDLEENQQLTQKSKLEQLEELIKKQQEMIDRLMKEREE